MARLDSDQLLELENYIINHITETLCRRNADDTLDRLLRELGMENAIPDLFGGPTPLRTWSDGSLLVVGCREGLEGDIIGVAKDLGVSRRRLKFVRYDDATNFDFGELEYSPKYSAILFGACPHSTRGTNGSRSILSRLEYLESHREKFPTVVRLVAESRGQGLKITKTNFRNAVSKLMDQGIVAADC